MGTGFKSIDGVASNRGRSPCAAKQEEVETAAVVGVSSKESRIFRSRLYLLMCAANLFCKYKTVPGNGIGSKKLITSSPNNI